MTTHHAFSSDPRRMPGEALGNLLDKYQSTHESLFQEVEQEMSAAFGLRLDALRHSDATQHLLVTLDEERYLTYAAKVVGCKLSWYRSERLLLLLYTEAFLDLISYIAHGLNTYFHEGGADNEQAKTRFFEKLDSALRMRICPLLERHLYRRVNRRVNRDNRDEMGWFILRCNVGVLVVMMKDTVLSLIGYDRCDALGYFQETGDSHFPKKDDVQ